MEATQPRPMRYGTWPSPITVESLANQTNAIEDVIVDPVSSHIYHVETRPSDGQSILIRTETNEDITPQGQNIRTAINGYGGAPAVAHSGKVFYTNMTDLRIYQTDGVHTIPATAVNKVWRYGNMAIHPTRPQFIAAIHEDWTKPAPSTIITTLCVIDTADGSLNQLSSGWDFYACPSFSPDGSKLAFLRWKHPDMPWQSMQLVVAEISFNNGTLHVTKETVVAGEPGETVASQPQWLSDDTLIFIYDKSGWGQPFLWDSNGTMRPLLIQALEEDFDEPLWRLGESTIAILGGNQLICTAVAVGFSSLYRIDISSGAIEVISKDFAVVRRLRRVNSNSVVFIGSKVDEGDAIIRLTLTQSGCDFQTLKSSEEGNVPKGFVSHPQSLILRDAQGRPLHAIYSPPTNPQYTGTHGEKPPLVVLPHGGPSSRTTPRLWWHRLVYTSRGWGWLDVNYGGSTGYGKEYLQRLNGQWGILDVEDCAQAVRQLSEMAIIDGDRVVIRGGSAGGYNVLQSLISKPSFYQAGVSHFGIADLKRLHETTHKFQSQYIPGLVGGGPEEIPEVYKARSPLFHAENIKRPLMIIHGKLDTAVPFEQARMIVKSIRDAGGEVEFMPFDDEGHGTRKAPNMIKAYGGELAFLERQLGLREV